MKILSTIFLLTCFFLTFGQTSIGFKSYYKSGKIQMESTFDKSCNCDKVNEYFENGKVRSTKTYLHKGLVNTQLDGDDILYFENGRIQIYYFWKDGTPSGRIYCNFENGKLAYEKFFKNKFKTGNWKFNNEDGTLKEELIFIENKTPWNSNEDYATNKFYYNNKLAYTIELVSGKKTKLKIADKTSYETLLVSERQTGQKLFLQNCSMCHSANADIVGPMLKGVTDKRTNDWLIKMITNGDALLKTGDKDAVELYKRWNNILHPDFEQLSMEELKSIVAYLETLN